MSEEILKALTQLFAIITKQDGGVTGRERLYVSHFFQTELDQDSVDEYLDLYDSYSRYETIEESGSQLLSVSDSVITLGICKKINGILTQKQKVVVTMKLLELAGPDLPESPQRREIINTVSSVFNLHQNEYHDIVKFAIGDDRHFLDFEEILQVDDSTEPEVMLCHHLHGHFGGSLFFLRVKSVEMFFVKYLGPEANMLNGFTMDSGHIYLFTHGSTIKSQAGDALYYSDIVAHFNDQIQTARLSFNAELSELKFASGTFGLRDFHISEGPGKLIGIMGASGAGKSTLLNVLAGVIRPENCKIRINGLDLHTQSQELHGVIGYVSQDDLLIEELTVYENLYFNAKLCFAQLGEEDIHQRVMDVLRNLGLDQRKDLRVGSALDKVISGGQRKRLNIALELIREPAILFLDEPTSGLSSRDSENIIDLLKELSLKGKLIFVVIHQPSSDIYKMFDKMIIMDIGGYPAYYGPPVEAISYFKKASHQVDSNRGQCHACGNVNPEQIFSIMDARVVDEYGQPTQRRKVKPWQWYEMFCERFQINRVPDVRERPPRTLHLPTRLRQAKIFSMRDLMAKVSNRQYVLINIIEAPLLALLLAFIIRYNSSPDGRGYLFRYNENFPAFLLMSIVVALFMGLSVSAEEIIRDRKILKRESFLHLSWNSYLLSKLFILFSLSAIQTFTFVIVGNAILEVEWKMLLPFWFVLFATSCMANVMGLNISSAFRSAVTVYVLIPLLLIPQMILSGVMFRFDRINEVIGDRAHVPLVADLMASRWAYEAMAVYQFKNNTYEAPLYGFDKLASQANFRSAYLADELLSRARVLDSNRIEHNRQLISRTLEHDPYLSSGKIKIAKLVSGLPDNGNALEQTLSGYKRYYADIYNHAISAREAWLSAREGEGSFGITEARNRYYNESLSNLVTNASVKNRIIEYDGKLVQQIDPVFQEPSPDNIFDYRAQFFAPVKIFLGLTVDTYWFNVMVIWAMTCVLYLALYAQVLRKAIVKLTAAARRGNL